MACPSKIQQQDNGFNNQLSQSENQTTIEQKVGSSFL